MKHKSCMILFMFMFSVCLSGCWDRVELQNLNIISAIGIDKGEGVNNRYRATIQIVDAPQIAGGQQGGKVQSAPVVSYTATGGTLAEALRKITLKTPGELFFPHVQLLLIGENMAKEGIQDLFDLIERDAQFRVLFPVIIVKGDTAEHVLQITTRLHPIPSEKIVGALEATKQAWGEYVSIRTDQVIQRLNEGAVSIAGVRLKGDVKKGNKSENMQEVSPDAVLETKGLALLKEGKLKKWLEGDEARGVTWINNEMHRTIINLSCGKKKNGVAVEVMRARSAIRITVANNKPIISITIYAEGNVLETHCPIDLGKNEVIEKLEQQMEQEIKEEAMKAIQVTQKQKSDVFGFGEFINIADKTLWKRIKSKWNDEVFPETKVNVQVEAFIRRAGMRTKPYLKQ